MGEEGVGGREGVGEEGRMEGGREGEITDGGICSTKDNKRQSL